MEDKPLTPNRRKDAAALSSMCRDGRSFQGACDDLGIVTADDGGDSYYVYALVRMDVDEIVYVGKGKNRRMFQHMRDVKAGRISGLKKHKGLKALIDGGVDVKPFAIFRDLTSPEACSVERIMIAGVRNDSLLNSSAGQRNRNEYEMQRAIELLEGVASTRELEIRRAGDFDIACQQRAAYIRSIERIIAEIKIADVTGHTYGNFLDEERFRARAAYLSAHPEYAPPPKIKWPRLSAHADA